MRTTIGAAPWCGTKSAGGPCMWGTSCARRTGRVRRSSCIASSTDVRRIRCALVGGQPCDHRAHSPRAAQPQRQTTAKRRPDLQSCGTGSGPPDASVTASNAVPRELPTSTTPRTRARLWPCTRHATCVINNISRLALVGKTLINEINELALLWHFCGTFGIG